MSAETDIWPQLINTTVYMSILVYERLVTYCYLLIYIYYHLIYSCIAVHIVYIWVTPRKPRPKLLNRGSQILLNFWYVIEEGVWWILTQADLKNIESFGFYEGFTKTPKIAKIQNWAYKCVDIPATAGPIELKFCTDIHLSKLHLW